MLIENYTCTWASSSSTRGNQGRFKLPRRGLNGSQNCSSAALDKQLECFRISLVNNAQSAMRAIDPQIHQITKLWRNLILSPYLTTVFPEFFKLAELAMIMVRFWLIFLEFSASVSMDCKVLLLFHWIFTSLLVVHIRYLEVWKTNEHSQMWRFWRIGFEMVSLITLGCAQPCLHRITLLCALCHTSRLYPIGEMQNWRGANINS
jgi:hypothetical protein